MAPSFFLLIGSLRSVRQESSYETLLWTLGTMQSGEYLYVLASKSLHPYSLEIFIIHANLCRVYIDYDNSCELFIMLLWVEVSGGMNY